jgi:hypothetical protein
MGATGVKIALSLTRQLLKPDWNLEKR